MRVSRACEGTLVDISEVGAYVQLPTPQKPEHQITLQLDLEDRTTLQVPGRVVRCIPHRIELRNAVLARTHYRVALEFCDLSEDVAAALKQVIRQEPLSSTSTGPPGHP